MSDEPALYRDVIDLVSLERNWPIGHQLPPLIADIATLLQGELSGSVGIFSMKGTRFDDYWIEGGADLCEQFGFFITLPDGSKVGQWFHDGAVVGAEPVIGLGSEGDLIVLAPNLKAFMRDWAKGASWLELNPSEYEDTPRARQNWQDVGAKMLAIIDAAPDHPEGVPVQNLEDFMATYAKAAIQKMATHPLHQAITELMAAHIPNCEDKLAHYYLQIKIAGSRIELLPNATPETYPKRAPIPDEAGELIPLILQLREERAGGDHVGRGLWNNASLAIYQGDIYNLPHPLVILKADWEFEPGFETGGRMTKAQLGEDLARFPRDPRWMMDWMGELV